MKTYRVQADENLDVEYYNTSPEKAIVLFLRKHIVRQGQRVSVWLAEQSTDESPILTVQS